MIGEAAVASYRENGFPVVEGVLGTAELMELRRVTDEFVAAAGGGAAVAWHQDWAFYPHTNDDLRPSAS
jgi:hypothetical protein